MVVLETGVLLQSERVFFGCDFGLVLAFFKWHHHFLTDSFRIDFFVPRPKMAISRP